MCFWFLIFSEIHPENAQEENFSYSCQLLHGFEILTPLEIILPVLGLLIQTQKAVSFPSIFSSPELKAQMSFSDRSLYGVCRRRRHCRCCHKLFTYSSSSHELKTISTKLGTKHLWVKNTTVCSK